MTGLFTFQSQIFLLADKIARLFARNINATYCCVNYKLVVMERLPSSS
jgi:hypothetical protein